MFCQRRHLGHETELMLQMTITYIFNLALKDAPLLSRSHMTASGWLTPCRRWNYYRCAHRAGRRWPSSLWRKGGRRTPPDAWWQIISTFNEAIRTFYLLGGNKLRRWCNYSKNIQFYIRYDKHTTSYLHVWGWRQKIFGKFSFKTLFWTSAVLNCSSSTEGHFRSWEDFVKSLETHLIVDFLDLFPASSSASNRETSSSLASWGTNKEDD